MRISNRYLLLVIALVMLSQHAVVGDLHSDWVQRSEHVQSIDVSWQGTRVEHRDGGATTQFPVSGRLTLAPRQRVRFDVASKRWSTEAGKFVRHEYADVFDGNKRLVYFTHNADQEFPSAHVRDGNVADVARDVRLLAIRWVYLPCDAELRPIDPAGLHQLSETATVKGVACQVARGVRDVVYVDPRRRHIPLRCDQIRRGKLYRRVDLEYETGSPPRLRGWQISNFRTDGRLDFSDHCQITALHLNTEIDPQRFGVRLVEGTWVRNYRTDETYIVRSAGPYNQPDRRVILAGEFTGDNYHELLRSEPGRAHTHTGISRWTLILGAVAACLGAAAATIFLFSHYRSSLQ